jgi:hypothetical protein
MIRLQHIGKVSLCVALLVTSTVRCMEGDKKNEAPTHKAIESAKSSIILKIVKGLLGGGGMIALSQAPYIKGTGLESGLAIGAIPAAIGCAVDDETTKAACFSAAIGSTTVGGLCGLFVTKPMICVGGIIERLAPTNNIAAIAGILRDAKIPQNAAGAVGVFGTLGVYGGQKFFNNGGLWAAQVQIVLEKKLSGNKK